MPCGPAAGALDTGFPMDIDWLRDFLALAETGNFTRAAASRNVSQAAFSRRIQALEAWAGATLVDRSTFPARLTAEGERFRTEAGEALSRLIDMRANLSRPAFANKAQVRIALPHILAGSRFTMWWKAWTKGASMCAITVIGNVTDIVAQFVAGGSDILICHHGEQLPVVFDPGQFERHVIERDRLRPYVARAEVERGSFGFPGTEDHPVPILMYSKGAYFARLVGLILEQAPAKLHADLHVEATMSEVLRDGIASGFGIGWLPECAVQREYRDLLAPIADDAWSMELDIAAFTHRHGRSPAAELLWRKLCGG